METTTKSPATPKRAPESALAEVPGSAAPVVHCWENGPDDASVCMLLDGHDGPHEFVPDDQVIITIKPPNDEALRRRGKEQSNAK